MDECQSYPPIVTMQELAGLRQAYRLQGKTVVSTNGCFDLLHAGHVRMLSQARRLGDVLVVGLNDDQSVRQLKGPNRPLVNQADRAIMLSSLKAVDHVVIFSGLLPNQMLELLQPDVHCKAADYTAESLPEADIVKRHGGRIHILPFQSGYATSELLSLASKAAGPAVSPAPDQTGQQPDEQDDLFSMVLSGLLNTANLCRQMSYQMAGPILQAARGLDRCRRNGGKIWVYADGTISAAQIVAQALPQGLQSSMIALPTDDQAARMLKNEAAPADMLLAVTGEQTQPGVIHEILLAAGEIPLQTVVIMSATSGVSPAAMTLSVPAPHSLQAAQLRLGVLQALGQAMDHLSRDS